MLRFLNRCSRGRGAWLLLAFTALALELTALYFQHVMLLKPCVLCIYQRSALWGVFAAGIVGAMAPSSLLRYPAIALWIYSSYEGVRLAWKHTDILLNPSPFNTCDFFVSFPSWLPLDKWLPAIFNATGDCSERQWSFLSMEMPQWLLGIFVAYLLISVLVLIAQPFRPKRRDLFSR
ncbi:disulfide bond formation protein DsbB [Pectobacterium parmentieri]|uniref:Disulfide bond formation protein B n=1 Tax=Pectobacterium parmentieri TaxID=1905730 RepID=A0A0H3I2M1_PECPM|nr:disulfide bond formation protein DsbB [Pectobacterium parmentieri]ACX88012.1 Disulphide bond formation protein DsbB [Pectobacterium parmentieri WPP163]AFI90272.1 Disulfide bond formation protein B [Pectobacterium parmentieri]AOR58735.1 disulfide bond formation protein B [Pectobacterium parmentieri]AYH01465.1 disulfide bond formation protein DsbB [Pectobacterium parmentieri]AYH05729.1 disulfide bond formation protein DsbB [Pectobacterium parmentieri]